MIYDQCYITSDGKKEDALKCCLKSCNGKPSCQEDCITGFNSKIKVYESFFYQYRKYTTLWIFILFDIFLFLGYFPTIVYSSTKNMIITIIIVQHILYYMFM